MKKYQFLAKPIFFIVNLMLATWLVLVVENIKPSDFSRYKSLFVPAKKTETEKVMEYKEEILKSSADYKAGIIDSITYSNEVEKVLKKSERK